MDFLIFFLMIFVKPIIVLWDLLFYVIKEKRLMDLDDHQLLNEDVQDFHELEEHSTCLFSIYLLMFGLICLSIGFALGWAFRNMQ